MIDLLLVSLLAFVASSDYYRRNMMTATVVCWSIAALAILAGIAEVS